MDLFLKCKVFFLSKYAKNYSYKVFHANELDEDFVNWAAEFFKSDASGWTSLEEELEQKRSKNHTKRRIGFDSEQSCFGIEGGAIAFSSEYEGFIIQYNN